MIDKRSLSFHFDITPDHLSPFPPQSGQPVTIRCRTALHFGAQKVFLVRKVEGEYKPYPLIREDRTGEFPWWAVTWELACPEEVFYFLIHTKNQGALYFSRGKASPLPPASRDHWVLQDSRDLPLWVPQSPVYHLYLDRYFRSPASPEDKNLRPWQTSPPAWEEGRGQDFYGGNLQGVTEKLSYLADLGIKTLYLSPPFQAVSHHGYDVTDFFQIEDRIGGKEAFADLCQQAHNRGLKIILDISLNHVSFRHPWTDTPLVLKKADGSLATWQDNGSFPVLDYRQDQVRNLMYRALDSVLNKWMSPPWSVDGWRFDVGNHLGESLGLSQGLEVFQEIRRCVKEKNSKSWLVGEHWQDPSRFLDGKAWDGATSYFGFTLPLRAFLGQRDHFIFGSGATPETISPLSAQDLGERILEHYQSLPGLLPQFQLNLLNSHDLPRISTCPELYHPEIYFSALILQYLLPGTPCLYYGDEVGLGGWAGSPEGARFPMEWREERWDKEKLQFFREFNRLKSHHPVLAWGNLIQLYADQDTLVLGRFLGEACLLGIINRTSQEKTLSLDLSPWSIQSLREVFHGSPGYILQDTWMLTLPAFTGGLWEGKRAN